MARPVRNIPSIYHPSCPEWGYPPYPFLSSYQFPGGMESLLFWWAGAFAARAKLPLGKPGFPFGRAFLLKYLSRFQGGLPRPGSLTPPAQASLASEPEKLASGFR